MRSFHTSIFLLVFLFITSSLSAQVEVDASWGNGLSLEAKDSSFKMKFGFRFQTLYDSRYQPQTKTFRDFMMIRRSRLKFDGYAFKPSIVYKLELGVSNRDTRGGRFDESGNTSNIILDAVVKWQFAPGWEFWFGQTKLPGNRERVISSQNLQFVDRSLVNSRFTLDRDIGIQLRKKHQVGTAVIKEAVAISMGEGRDIIVSNPSSGHEYTLRVEALPFGDFTNGGDYFGADLVREPRGKLSLGVTYDYNSNTPRSRGNLGDFITDANGDYMYSDLNTLFIDAIYKQQGFSVVGEYAYRTSKDRKASFGYGQGITLSAGYLFKTNFEIAGRFTHIDPVGEVSSIRTADEYMIGLSKYIVGHSLKIQSDFSYTEVPGNTDFLMFRLQCEVAL